MKKLIPILLLLAACQPKVDWRKERELGFWSGSLAVAKVSNDQLGKCFDSLLGAVRSSMGNMHADVTRRLKEAEHTCAPLGADDLKFMQDVYSKELAKPESKPLGGQP